MNKHISVKIIFNDRFGFIADIANSIVEYGLNINSMELEKEKEFSNLYVGLDCFSPYDENEFLDKIRKIDSVVSVLIIPYLPYVERQIRYQIVLDSVSDGIIAIDKNKYITTLNEVASEIFSIDLESSIGKSIDELEIDFTYLNKALNRQKTTSITKTIKTNKGVFQYLSISKPVVNKDKMTVGAIEIIKSIKEIKELARSIDDDSLFTFEDIITNNPEMIAIIEMAKKVSFGDSPILLQGESGTGKECIANAIHNHSARDGGWVAINCAAIPESLMESELFGYESGAFTGANKKTKIGLIELANKGTLFLDEISELSLVMQAKLLRVLQERKLRRIGGEREIKVDIKIITATNQNLELLVERKEFREDLFYRLNVFPINIPPLRYRKEDIPLLFQYFIDQLNLKLYRKIKHIDKKVIDKLLNYDWKGNVRELKNVVERAFILSDSDTLYENHIIFSKKIDDSDLDENTLNTSLKNMVADFEKRIILSTLKSSPSIRQAAKKLNISHVALINKIKKYGIEW